MPALFITPRNVHCDEKSFEAETGNIKRKYKVAGNSITALDFYPFYLVTSKQDSYKLWNRIEIHDSDWEEKKKIHLNSKESYISPDHIEVLTIQKIEEKTTDHQNGFQKVAKLPERLFNRLQILVSNSQKQSHQLPQTRYINQLAVGVPLSADMISHFKDIFGLS